MKIGFAQSGGKINTLITKKQKKRFIKNKNRLLVKTLTNTKILIYVFLCVLNNDFAIRNNTNQEM